MRWITEYRTHIVLWIAYTCMSIYTLSCYLQVSALGDVYYQVKYEKVLAGEAWKPFAYRVLFPQAVLAIDAVTPEIIKDGIAESIDEIKSAPEHESIRRFMPWLNKAFPQTESHYVRFIAVVLMYGVIVMYGYTLYRLGVVLFPGTVVAWFAPLFGMFALTSFSWPLLYLYDFPAALFFASALYFIYQRRLRAYLLVFFLAVLNKETACFIAVYFAMWNMHRMPTRIFALSMSVQAFIYLSVKALVSIIYASNQGVFLDSYTYDLLAKDVLAVSDVDKIIAASVLFFLFTYLWREKPLFLKYTLWLLPVYFVAYILYGRWNEYRVFIDIHAPLVLLATHTLVVGTGLSKSPVFRTLEKKDGAL